MSFLLDMLAKNNEEFEDSWNRGLLFGIPTGFTCFDVMTSTIEKDEYRKRTRLNGGLFSQIYSFTGESGTGKSTLLMELLGGSIVNLNSMYNNAFGEAIYFDNEGHASAARFSAVTGWNDIMIHDKLFLDKETFSPSAIYNIIRKIAESKEERKKELTIYSKMSSLDNKLHSTLAPTYVVIDSVANMSEAGEFEHYKSGELKDEILVGNMDGMVNAKNNTNLLKKIKPFLIKYNICILLVNHIVDKPKIDPYAKVNRSLPWLPANKTIKGGVQMFFQTAYLPYLELVRMHDNEKNKIYGDNIHGQINSITFYKNKNGVEGVSCPLVFDSSKGYLPELSDFEYLINVGYGFSGTGTYFLDILPEIKLNRKTLYEMCQANPMIARAIQFTAKIHMIYKWIKHSNPPDLKQYLKLELKDRLKLIYSFTSDYPIYKATGNTVSKEHIKMIMDSKLDFGDTVLKYFDENAARTIENLFLGLRGFTTRINIEDVILAKERNNGKIPKIIYNQKSKAS